MMRKRLIAALVSLLLLAVGVAIAAKLMNWETLISIPEVGANGAWANSPDTTFRDLVIFKVRGYLFPLASSLFVSVYGLFFLVLAAVFAFLAPDIKGQVVSSLLCVDLGFWALSLFGLLDIVFDVNMMVVSYFSFYLMLPLSCILLYEIHDVLFRPFVIFVIAGSVVVCALAIGAYGLGLAPIVAFKQPAYFFFMLILVVIVMYTIHDIRARAFDKWSLAQMAGPILFALCSIPAMVMYMFFGFQEGGDPSRPVRNLLITGGLLFALSRFVVYLIYAAENNPREKEYDSLKHLARVDGLCNIPNRTSYYEKIAQLQDGAWDYCVISLDLRGLKEINDGMGHSAGDELIKDFAAMLQAAFSPAGFCARIGGDEFVGIVETDDPVLIESLVGRLNESLDAYNVGHESMPCRVDVGYAFLHERPGSAPHEIYLLADERMYEHKAIAKARAQLAR